jgi:hypothetical protein
MIVTSVEHSAHRDKRIGKPWQRYLRISLRGLIVLVLVIGSGLGWIINRAKVQRDAVAVIERAGGSVKYQWDWKDEGPNSSGKPRWARWLLDYIGPNYLAHIAAVGEWDKPGAELRGRLRVR